MAEQASSSPSSSSAAAAAAAAAAATAAAAAGGGGGGKEEKRGGWRRRVKKGRRKTGEGKEENIGERGPMRVLVVSHGGLLLQMLQKVRLSSPSLPPSLFLFSPSSLLPSLPPTT